MVVHARSMVVDGRNMVVDGRTMMVDVRTIVNHGRTMATMLRHVLFMFMTWHPGRCISMLHRHAYMFIHDRTSSPV
jgi:hypothetical protein